MPDATTPIAGALANVVSHQGRQIARRLPGAAEGNVEAVHRVRVASRRLREVLAIAVEAGLDGDAARLRREVRRVTRALGPVRELDVALDLLERDVAARGWPPEPAVAVRRHLERERDRLRTRMLDRLSRLDRRTLRETIDTVARAVAGEVTRDWRRLIALRACARARGVIAAVRHCGTLYAPDRLHALRIAVKKFRYALEAARVVPNPAATRAIEVLRQAQRQFGDWHDAQVLLGQVHATAARARRPLTRAGFEILIDALERDCRERHAQLLRRLPALEACARECRTALTIGARGIRARALRMTVAGPPARGRTFDGRQLQARRTRAGG